MTDESNGLVEMTKIARLGAKRVHRSKDNRDWSPIDCLGDCILDIRSGATPCDKLFVLRIDTRNEQFNVGYHAANMRASEILAALECAKAEIMQNMGY
jgi:hypothetical protein